MIEYIIVLCILACTFFIGQRVAAMVLDESVPAKRGFEIGVMLLLCIMMLIVSAERLAIAVGIVLSIVVLAFRKFTPYTFAAVSGLLFALSRSGEIVLLLVAMNYLIGLTQPKNLHIIALVQLVAGLAVVI